MSSLLKILGLLILLTVAVGAEVCTTQELAKAPCVCCKKQCWSVGVEIATEIFGNMPGERSDNESKFALELIRRCIQTDCVAVCASSM